VPEKENLTIQPVQFQQVMKIMSVVLRIIKLANVRNTNEGTPHAVSWTCIYITVADHFDYRLMFD
jgi:hypothetical protein